ncbi:MAG: phosphoglycolate phosphatase [Neptuniibacter sp.]
MRQLFANKKPKLVLFDLDGTLVDSVPDLANAIDRMLLELGKETAGIERVRSWVGNGAAVLVQRALAGSMETQISNSDEFDNAYALFLKFYGENTADQSRLYEGVVECLVSLQNQQIKMGLVTNKPIIFTRTMLAGFNLAEYFDVVIGGDSLPQKKPSPEPLLEAMASCSASPSETLMVGDSKSDVGAARAAGCPVICVPYGYNHGEDIAKYEPDLIVQSLAELV